MISASRLDLLTCRCRTCGLRIPGAGGGCPEHGHATAPELVTDATGRDIQQARAGAPPSFPGFGAARLVGVGGFGAVFAAQPEGGGPEVAIKLARPDRQDAAIHLLHEARALSEVGPPHVPALYACARLPDGAPYLVMALVRCPTLADRLLAAAGPLPPREAAGLAGAALHALEALHGRGYVHRDLKPENLFIDDAPRATLVDLGLASTDGATPMTDAGAALGTAEYMAPEQCEGRALVDARADIYSMGVIVYELLTGRPPFWGPPAVVREDHRSRRPARLSTWTPVPAAIEDVVLRCLAKDPGDRWSSAAALREALERAALQPAGSTSVTPSRADAGPTSSRRHVRRTVGLLLFDTDLDVVTLHRRLAGLGGELAHAAGGRCAAVFEHDAGASPAPRALGAARELIQRGECAVALVDLAAVLVQRRRDGTRRFLSPLFSCDHQLPPPGPGGAPRLFITLAVAAVLPDVTLAAASTPTPPGLLQVPIHDDTESGSTSRPLIGRAHVLEPLLEGARAAVCDRAPTVVRVIGDTGFGKTHLAGALGKCLRQLGPAVQIVELRAREPLACGTDRAVRELLQHALELPAAPPARGGRTLLRSRLEGANAELEPAIALALGWTTPPGADRGASPVDPTAPTEEMEYPELQRFRAAPGALRSALTAAAGEVLRRRADRIPLLILLDDAHIADEAALSALEHAARAEAGAPLWICALGRPGFEETRPGWGERAARCLTFRLGPLEPEGAYALCRQMLRPAEDVPEPAIRRLVERAQSIPLLIVELVLGLRREGILRRDPRGDSWYLATDELDRLPDIPMLEWLAHGEIDALPPALQEHARLVALLGPEATTAEIAGVLGRLERQGEADAFPLDARIATERLIAAGVLVRDRRRGQVAFRHALVREVVAGSTPEPLRRRIHRAAYAHHRDHAADADEPRLLALAHHAAEAGCPEIAEITYLTLAERARSRHAYFEAEALYSRALEQAILLAAAAPPPATCDTVPEGALPADDDPGARRAAEYRGRGLMRYRLGRYHDTLADLACARAIAGAQGDIAAEIGILLDEATALDWMDEYRSSLERVEQAKALAARLTPLPPVLGARLLLGVGRSLHRFCRELEAADALERAARDAADLGDEGYETRVVALLMLGFIDAGRGRLDEAAAALDRAIALCEARRDTLHLVPAINNRALVWLCRGDKARMVADLDRVLSLARDLGLGMLELVGEYNLGEYLYFMDDVEAAAPHVERAVAIEQRRAGNAGRPAALLLEARFLLHRGDEPGARALFERIRDGQEAARAEARADALLLPSEEVLHAMIDLATRDAPGAAWDDLLARSARCSVGQERVEVLEARAVAAMRRGHLAAARRALTEALAAAARVPNAMRDRLRRRDIELTRMEGGR